MKMPFVLKYKSFYINIVPHLKDCLHAAGGTAIFFFRTNGLHGVQCKCSHGATRIHSSRMRTFRLLTVSQHAHALGRGVCMPGGLPRVGVSARGGGGSLPREGCLPRGVCGRHPPVNRMTDVKTLPCRNFVAGGNYDNDTKSHIAY